MKKLFLFLILISIFRGTAFSQQPTLWQSLPFEFNDNPSVMYVDSTTNTCYIAGAFSEVNDSICNIVQLNGNSYRLLPPSPLEHTNCIIEYKGKLYVGGYGYPVNLACWDGHTWTSLDSSSALILCFYIYKGKLLIGGNFNNFANTGIGSIASWDGNSWEGVFNVDTLLGSFGWAVSTIMEYKDELYIAGNFNDLTNPSINEIARFDGTRWRDVGHFQDGNLSDVRKLLVWKDTLYVGGSFRESDGSPGNGIAKWDGDHWHRLSRGVLQSSIPAVTDMKVLNDNLYITGWFYWVDEIQFPNISFLDFAKWDGHRWCTMGTHADNVILTMGEYRDSLYIMGAFDSLNNQPMHRMAKWIGGDYTDSCSLPDTTSGIANQSDLASNSLSVFPNPTTDLLNIHFHSGSNQKQEAAIQIADLSGRVMQAGSRHIEPGDNFFQFDVSKLAPGMYFLTLINGQDKSVVKFVKQ